MLCREVGRWVTKAAVVALLWGCGGSAGAGERPRGYHGVAVDDPLEKPPQVLVDTRGRPYDFREETAGKVALLFFGFTSCPDICPVHMANVAAVMHDLPPGVRERVEVVFVATDPERDTPEAVRAWLDNFDRRFVGLVGPKERVDSMQLALRLPPAARVELEGGDYTIAHAAQILVFTPDGRAHLQYPFGTRQVDWARDLPRLVEERWTD